MPTVKLVVTSTGRGLDTGAKLKTSITDKNEVGKWKFIRVTGRWEQLTFLSQDLISLLRQIKSWNNNCQQNAVHRHTQHSNQRSNVFPKPEDEMQGKRSAAARKQGLDTKQYIILDKSSVLDTCVTVWKTLLSIGSPDGKSSLVLTRMHWLNLSWSKESQAIAI